MEVYNFEQRSPEWYEIRKGRMTASKASCIAKADSGLDTYIIEIMSEYFSIAPKEMYINDDMQRGIDLEPEAKLVYELEKSVTVEPIGFVIYNEYAGASPDGLVDDDGLIEIKCPKDTTYTKLLYDEKIKPDYVWQMQMQMLITGRKWCDFVAYNDHYDKNVFIKRVERDEEKIQKLIEGITKGGQLIEKIKAKINGRELSESKT